MHLLRFLPVVLVAGLASVAAQCGKALAGDDGLSARYADLIDCDIDPRGLVSEIWDDIKNAATCTACEVRVQPTPLSSSTQTPLPLLGRS